MSFPRYERYKDSEVEWLGEVPEHWRIAPLYSLGKEREESNVGLISNNLLSLSYGRIIEKDIETSNGLLPESFETYQIVHPGDIIFRLTDLQNDKRSLRTAIVTQLGIITFAYAAFEPRAIMPAYLSYLLRDYDLRKIFYSMGGGVRQSMKFDDIRRLPTLVPSKNEQSTIVKFLDYETAKIDALIDEQHRLIELLKEKRQAVISHAVTHGLNLGAEMKASGFEWLGSISKSWDVLPIKWVTKIESGHTPDKKVPAYWDDGDIPWVSLNDTGYLRDNDYIADTAYYTTPAGLQNSSARLLPERAVVFSRDATIGRCAITTRPMAVSQHFIAWLCSDRVLPEYLLRVCYAMQPELERLSTGATIKTIGMADINALVMPLPPVLEQLDIIEHITRETAIIDSLAAKAEQSHLLLRERRSTLISAAVTGKIDVSAYMAKPVISATQYSSGFAHQLLAAEILDRCNSQRMGRIKLQKLIHLCEYHAQVSEVQGDYSRKAAGPFDARAMAGISKNLKKQRWYEEVKEGERYVYQPLEKRGEHKKYLAHWQAEMPRIEEVLRLLGAFKTRECEIVSTLYAAWNDLLIDAGLTDDAAILHEASSAERWHKSKEQIAPERWKKALQWMKDKGLVPVGYGKHTRHTAGQIGTTTKEAHEPA